MGWRLVCVAIATTAMLQGCSDGGGDDDDGGGDGDADADECDELFDFCEGESICIDGRCEDAFGRIYRFSEIEVSLPDRNPDGDTWDSLGGAPDPFVEIWLGRNDLIVRTAVADDDFSVRFRATGDAEIPAGATVEIDVWDEDVTEHDLPLVCTADPLSADLLRGRTLVCDGPTSVSLTVEPR